MFPWAVVRGRRRGVSFRAIDIDPSRRVNFTVDPPDVCFDYRDFFAHAPAIEKRGTSNVTR